MMLECQGLGGEGLCRMVEGEFEARPGGHYL